MVLFLGVRMAPIIVFFLKFCFDLGFEGKQLLEKCVLGDAINERSES